MSRLARLAVPAFAAAVALAVTAPMIADLASARPARPDYQNGTDRLRAENEQLRIELGYYQSAYTELSTGLDRVDAANRRNKDRRSFMMIDRALRGARDRAAQYVQPWSAEQQQPDWRDHGDWRTMPAPIPTPNPGPFPPGSVRDRRTQPQMQIQVVAIDERAFASLTAEVGRASFADDKLAVVRTAAATNYFTVAQVVQLMKLASFDDTRVEIAAALAPRVLDGDKWFEVYGALSFSSSRDTLRERLGDR
jgi:hypothetical protein